MVQRVEVVQRESRGGTRATSGQAVTLLAAVVRVAVLALPILAIVPVTA